ncbi:hypothetical protein CNE_BB1p03630 (plasmid) [Cupriavidus necator N-1]|uniref:Uncharacterized protein n=1 Tax=Cupriavidus necator (strain ATCC 43291 / DSM 13513 / CCUG 52238 / LMG 8453 / N-1) TaxID=1042878 RepID=F8GWR7_CUPNN|nr:hypothetical protein CNE_BB1p03630 [Cupriavidus necator N-1]
MAKADSAGLLPDGQGKCMNAPRTCARCMEATVIFDRKPMVNRNSTG